MADSQQLTSMVSKGRHEWEERTELEGAWNGCQT